ncbi:hypothetical protein J6590_005825 [Homalodisca vitripennis]|nr:hypothetical protein J6590_005825 [Homalodisca vitripennis]
MRPHGMHSSGRRPRYFDICCVMRCHRFNYSMADAEEERHLGLCGSQPPTSAIYASDNNSLSPSYTRYSWVGRPRRAGPDRAHCRST